jgi:predicted nucleic acid-binding protein
VTTDTKVVDCSALARLLFSEPDAEAMVERLSARRLYAPSHLPYEFGNVATTKLRRKLIGIDDAYRALRAFDRFGIRLIACPTAPVLQMAAQRSLTFHDAAYLWLAHDLGAELVTIDNRLAAAVAWPPPS